MYSVGMESLLTILIIILLLGNFLAIVFLIKRKQPEPVNNEQIFKDELSSLKIHLANLWVDEQRNSKRYDRCPYKKLMKKYQFLINK